MDLLYIISQPVNHTQPPPPRKNNKKKRKGGGNPVKGRGGQKRRKFDRSQKQGKKIVIKSHSALQDGCFAEEE